MNARIALTLVALASFGCAGRLANTENVTTYTDTSDDGLHKKTRTITLQNEGKGYTVGGGLTLLAAETQSSDGQTDLTTIIAGGGQGVNGLGNGNANGGAMWDNGGVWYQDQGQPMMGAQVSFSGGEESSTITTSPDGAGAKNASDIAAIKRKQGALAELAKRNVAINKTFCPGFLKDPDAAGLDAKKKKETVATCKQALGIK